MWICRNIEKKKQALEEELARKQAEKQKEEAFNTPEERVVLKEAAKILKAEPSLQRIDERREQLDKWENRVNNNSQYIRWKDEKLKEAADHYSSIHTFEKQIQEAQKRVEMINWVNPLKIKENRMVKDQALQEIAHAEAQIQFHDKKLNYHREKLKFHTETDFRSIQTQHQTEYPGLLEKNRDIRGRIHHERNVIQKVEDAFKNAFVRQVASLYPERPEMRYMSLETAKKIVEINKLNGTVVPIEKIEKTLHNRQEEIQRLQGELTHLERNQSRLQRAEGYLKNYEEYHAVVEKTEWNPFLKGKTLISTSANQEYERAVSGRDHYHDLMKKEGVSGRGDFEKQAGILGGLEAQAPQIKEQVQAQQAGIGILEAVIKGIEQASRDMQREQNRQQHQLKRKNKRQWNLDR